MSARKPKLTRRKLKTLIKDGDSAPAQSIGQQDIGAPKGDTTFARDTVPNTTYTSLRR